VFVRCSLLLTKAETLFAARVTRSNIEANNFLKSSPGSLIDLMGKVRDLSKPEFSFFFDY
jgi:hypothetical protein